MDVGHDNKVQLRESKALILDSSCQSASCRVCSDVCFLERIEAAHANGELQFPTSILLRADEVIE
jgi:hypothetical protein